MTGISAFETEFAELVQVDAPLSWQRRLFRRLFEGNLPAALDLPTGLGKTAVMAIWLIARAHEAHLPRRLVYVVDRRAVVDQATAEAEKLKKGLEERLPHLKIALGLGDRQQLPISTLRGQFVDNREWLADPAAPAIIVGTADMIGSRLLFSGYGVSRKMRPYHAGLLGADALVVLDEAHLVPPFEKLLETIETGTKEFGPRGEEAPTMIPRFRLLSLSATGRERQGDVFRLCKEDFDDAIVKQRLDAPKRIKVEAPFAASDLPGVMADRAWQRSAGGRRVIVFCDSRKIAQQIHDDLKEKLKKNFRGAFGKPDAEFADAIELVVGARRVHERDRLANSKVFKRFSPKTQEEEANADVMPAFLVCTSAGEVGVDIDADHAICDLVPWERMVQRLGRVNRRGKFSEGSLIDVYPALSDKDKEAEIAGDEAQLATWRRPFECELWPIEADTRRDASPGKLQALRQSDDFRMLADAATTPSPLRPALTRPLVEAWAMTSLAQHTGRPEIAPWLRGWIEDEPQTTVVWRMYLPVRQEGARVSEAEVKDFFEAAPPHTSEALETETWRVVDWLMHRAERSTHNLGKAKPTDGDAEPSSLSPVTMDSVVAFALAPDGTLRKWYHLRDLIKSDDNRKRRERLEAEFRGATLIVDFHLGGLTDGLLDKDEDKRPPTMDSDEEWSRKVGVRIRNATTLEPPIESEGWRFEGAFAAKEEKEDGEVAERLIIECLKSSDKGEDGRAISSPQSLSAHQTRTADKARVLAEALRLEANVAHALEIAARFHDEGKKAPRWQRAFNAPRGEVYAKTKGPINQALLAGYRHEFGSLRDVVKDAEFQGLSGDLQDLVLHLVAAHHGRARPVIETMGCDDAPPSVLEARARDVALRFARLQKIWGPWGLAWWESLLRAADQLASRENDETKNMDEKAASEEAA